MKTLQEILREKATLGFTYVEGERDLFTVAATALDTLEAEVARLRDEVAQWANSHALVVDENNRMKDPVSRPQTQDATLSDIARAFNTWTPPTTSKEDVVIAIARALERAEKSPSGYIPAMIANDLQAAGLLSTERERGLEEADWQAIETAPKDGRDVILKMPFGVNGIRAFWCDDLKRWVLRFPLNVESILHPAGWRQADRSLKRSQEKG